ncbi:LuxR C-terminal-related transcriptional regulator [Tengunoibacter tsumagoiensis]|uniref:Helix-turn-helix transcriptional regulator n=1 Tax=Tengunoibacter tsumagoiensis TaxID=2014871 RepID=A0A402A7W1_9CHLR|nr:LuxR C-terminal-related transcriptional regulator [Tengunoibacter tsumagoiensis]GCE15260.1 helix-turn-helix transcriptional regulator [Tengunoibacter tsumagoiensis]
MPRRTTYRIIWSEELQRYTMTGGAIAEEIPQPTSSEWVPWLCSIRSFSFVSRTGIHYTARQEKLQRGSTYWYGYRSHEDKTIKRYIGKTIDLSIRRLEEVAAQLTGENRPAPPVPQSTNNGKQSNALTIRHTPIPSSWQKDHADEPLILQRMPLLISKLHPPHLPSTLIARPDVLALLDAGMAYKLTLLATPAGFGKTTTVSQWVTERQTHATTTLSQLSGETTAHSTHTHTAWVSLDEGDNDPVRFWRYIIAACQSFHADLGRSALALLFSELEPPFELPSQEMMLTLLLNDITHFIKNGLLILDDYHVITEPRIHAMMIFFIDHLPTSLHILLLTRSEPPLPLIRWRSRGELQDIHTADLRFSPAETTAFLQQSLSPRQITTLSDDAIGDFARGMEGWAAGLRLLQLTLPGQPPHSELEHQLALLSGSSESRLNATLPMHPRIVEYFITEVLNAQPEVVQHFLLQTSMLSRLTGSLCDTVTGQQDCAMLLERIERAGLFLEALEGANQAEPWYRYHALFAEAMRKEARTRLGAEQIRTLAQAASQWYEHHGLFAEAVDAALSAQELERAAFLIGRICTTTSFYEMHTLLHWLSQIPETILEHHPELYFYEALALLFAQAENEAIQFKTGRINERLQRAEQSWRASENYARLGEVFAFRALVIWRHGEIVGAGTYARQALDWLPPPPTRHQKSLGHHTEKIDWRSICLAVIGMETMNEGNLDEAYQKLQEARECSLFSGNKSFTRATTIMLSSILLMQGKLYQATEYIQQVLSEARAKQDWEDVIYAVHGLMGIAYERNDQKAMEQWERELEEIDKQSLGVEWQEMIHLYPALLHHLRGKTIEAQQQLTALLARVELIQSPHVLSLLFDIQNWQIRLQLALGDLPAAQHSLLALSQHKAGFSRHSYERLQLLEARLFLAQGDAPAALTQFESLLAIAHARQRTREALEIQVLMVLAYAACKQKQEARSLLRQTLVQTHSEGYMRLFLDEGEPLAVLLRTFLPTVQEKWLRTYIHQILHAFHLMASETDPQTRREMLTVEPLSPQEQRVLRLLVAGQTNPQMARELVVSVNTIKAHVKNLYRKLQVNNRLEASEVARHLKLF